MTSVVEWVFTALSKVLGLFLIVVLGMAGVYLFVYCVGYAILFH